MPYLFTISALLSTLHSTRQPSEAFAASPQFSELVLSLATVLDVMEAKTHLGKETAKDARFRRKIHIRTWRLLREVSGSGAYTAFRALMDSSERLSLRFSTFC